MNNMPLEIINKIVMMSVPKYEYMQQLKVSINILNSKKKLYYFQNKEETHYNLINYIGWEKALHTHTYIKGNQHTDLHYQFYHMTLDYRKQEEDLSPMVDFEPVRHIENFRYYYFNEWVDSDEE